MIRKGAYGYLFKNMSKTELLDAIQTVYNREIFTNPAIRNLLKDEDKPKKRTYQISNEIVLTPMETKVLFLISEGLTTQQIANKLFVTLKAVEFHRSSLPAKFDVPKLKWRWMRWWDLLRQN